MSKNKEQRKKHSAFYLRLKKSLKCAIKEIRDGNAKQHTVCSDDSAPLVTIAFPLCDYWLLLFFENGEIRLYDCAWALQHSSMEKLHKMNFFKKVRITHNGVKWNKNIEMGTEELYGNSTPLTDYEGNLLKLL